MGRLIEYDDEDQEIMFGGRRSMSIFRRSAKETVDFWDQQRRDDLELLEDINEDIGDREPVDRRADEEPYTRGYRHRPVYNDGRDDWN